VMKNDLPNLLPGLQSLECGEWTAFCAEDHVIAAFYDQRLEHRVASRLKQHLAGCGHCRARIGMLHRLEQDESDAAVNGDLLARAKLLSGGRPSRRRLSPALAAAAVVVLALGAVFSGGLLRDPGTDSVSPAPGAAEAVRQVRGLEASTRTPEILHPPQGAELAPGTLEVRWTPVEGSLRYELLVLDASGALVADASVQDTHWRSGESVALKPGRRYFLRVSALLADGRTVGSQHTAISVHDADPGRQ